MSKYKEFYEYITQEGDRWDLIAYQFYGDAEKYEPIIESNPYVAIKPVLPSGIKLQIPVIETLQPYKPEGLPPWIK